MAVKSTHVYGLFLMSSLALIIGAESTPIGRNPRGSRRNDDQRGPQGQVGPWRDRRRSDYYTDTTVSSANNDNAYKITTELQCQEYLCKYGYLYQCNCQHLLTRYRRDTGDFQLPSEHVPGANRNNQFDSNSHEENLNLAPCTNADYANGYRNFQTNYQLAVTSTCDQETMKMMSVRRCGQPDIIEDADAWDHHGRFRGKRDQPGMVSQVTGLYAANTTKTEFRRQMQLEHYIKEIEQSDLQRLPQEPPITEDQEEELDREKRSMLSINLRDSVGILTKSRVTWRMMNSHYTTSMTRATQIGILKQAFRYWSEVSPICFVLDERSSRVDIAVGFLEGRHLNCFKQFDGLGGEVAHKFYRDVHFDKTEPYTERLNAYNAVSLKLVAAHEIGHVLGLNHSTNRRSVMNAIYRQNIRGDFELTQEDRDLVKGAYGECSGSFNTVFDFVRNNPNSARRTYTTYFFRGDHAWAYDNHNQKPSAGYPFPVAADWSGVPSNIDTFIHIAHNLPTRDYHFFFKGDRYYRYDASRERVTSQGRISDVFKAGRQHRIPSNLDAAYYEYMDQKCYFFKGIWVYTYDCSKYPTEAECCVEKTQITTLFPPKSSRELQAPDRTTYRSNIDAVYHSWSKLKLYIIKSNHVWVAENYSLQPRRQNKDYRMKYLGQWNEHWHFICDSDCT